MAAVRPSAALPPLEPPLVGDATAVDELPASPAAQPVCAAMQRWIDVLRMQPHPEGGWYAESFRSSAVVTPTLNGAACPPRPSATACYFLLQGGHRSALHRLAHDEVWCFHDGQPVKLHLLGVQDTLCTVVLGRDPCRGELPSFVVPGGTWFGATVDRDVSHYALVSCLVTPGFDFADFELGARGLLCDQFPQHTAFVRSMTREHAP